MANTVITPGLGYPNPYPTVKPVIQIRHDWSADWQVPFGVTLTRCACAVSGHDLGSAEIARRYGRVAYPGGDGQFYIETPMFLDKWWLRISLPVASNATAAPGEMLWSDNDGFQYSVIWIGQISNEVRDIAGKPLLQGDSGVTNIDTGVQVWAAWEPLHLLRKIGVSESYFYTPTTDPEDLPAFLAGCKRIGWVPDFNARDKKLKIVPGNGKHYTFGPRSYWAFGGKDLWTRLDMLWYIIDRFIQQHDSSGTKIGPIWWVGGQVDLLNGTDTVLMWDMQSAADCLRNIIPLRLGLDYTIRPKKVYNDEGFEIYIYSVTPQTLTFDNVSLAANPDTVEFVTHQTAATTKTQVVISHDLQFDTVRLVGKRQVICCTLAGANAVGVDAALKGSLVPRWTTAQEDVYKAGTGNTSDQPSLHDHARASDHMRMVYQLFGTPATWDRQCGKAAPTLSDTGSLVDNTAADYQNAIGRVLPWVPLREGFDYSVQPPTDSNPPDHEPALLPCKAWVYDESLSRYVAADAVGISVHVCPMTLAVYLGASPNHLLAFNQWDPGGTSLHTPKYDYTKLIVTLAFEADQRAVLQAVVGSGNDGSAIDVPATDEQSDMEWWYIVEKTILDIAADGTFKTIGNAGQIVRDDTQRMKQVMVGAIGRYYYERVRAIIEVEGLKAWSWLMGQIWTGVFHGADSAAVEAPFTAIEWICQDGAPKSPGKQKTIIRGGFCR